MTFSRTGILLSFILCSFLFGCSKPLMVTHWTAKDKAMLQKGRKSFGGKKPFGYPSHKWYSRIVCFDDKCRNKAEWVKKQRSHRFKGFKDGGKLPAPPPRRSVPEDTVLLASTPQQTQQTPQTPGQTTQAAEPAAPITPTIKTDSLIVLSEVLFEVNSYRLRPDLYPKLDSIVLFLQKNPSTRIEISGHTDNTGSEAHNLRLSENRADAVAEYVVDKGIGTARVSFNGYGSSRPISDNETEVGRRKNRRVEILIHNKPR